MPGMRDKKMSDVIRNLKKLPSAISYDGEMSTQVVFKLTNGSYLRIGQTEDVDGIWCDEGYKGLFGELNNHTNEDQESIV